MRRSDVGTAIVGIALLAPGISTTVEAVRHWSVAAAYASAAPCGPGETGSPDCVADRAAKVLTPVDRSRRGGGHEIYYDVAGLPLADEAARGQVELLRPDPLFDELRPGSAIRVRMWRGLVTHVSSDGGASLTDDLPATRAVAGTLEAGLWAFSGLTLLVLALGRRPAAAVLGAATGVGYGLKALSDRLPFTEGATPLAAFLVGTLGVVWLLEVSRTGLGGWPPRRPGARPAAR